MNSPASSHPKITHGDESDEIRNMDPRHRARLKTVQTLYAALFDNPTATSEKNEIADAITAAIPQIDTEIARNAPKYPIEKISKIDLSILRLAIYELKIAPVEPVRVVINEAVELAKEIGSERSYAFINAVLGSILQDVKSDEATENGQ